jgi:hypothetical protein
MSTEANPADGPSVNQRDRVTDRDTEPTTDRVTDVDGTAPAPGRHEVVRRQREAYGGIKFGSCFFGWLTATGTAVLLTALVAAAGLGSVWLRT